MRAFLSIIFSLGLVSAVSAADADQSDWAFTCVDRAKLADVSAGTDIVRINNFSLREAAAFGVDGLSDAEITFSVANRGSEGVHLKGQFLLMDAAQLPIVAMSAGPSFDLVAGHKTEAARGTALIREGELQSVTSICIRIVGEF
ncbi:hypothetical protein [Breoghania sp.]|uniref:hypothetical protein n=1 Tax=Breoghania sp. TaxID=2065378 RepID=UPI0029CA8BBD|nr:hypothetical protein [Breoghania sp.]